MQIKLNQKTPVVSILFTMILACLFAVSCKDDYIYDEEEPNFPGAGFTSMYDFMEQDGNFKYFLRLINDLNYKEVLSRTGSKTLFPVRDDAFERFFQSNNSYGVRSYDDFTPAQKRIIMNVSMVNMAYLSYMLSNVQSTGGGTGSGEGVALRHHPANTYLDSISFVKDETLFDNPYWSRFKSKGLYLVDDESVPYIVHFTPQNMSTKGITSSDFSTLYNGKAYEAGSFYVNGIKIVQADIICKNGYIHVMEDLLLPIKNMAQIIRDNGETSLFNKLMNKYCMPYYVETISKDAHAYYDGSTPDRKLIPASDTVYTKRYFTDDFKEDDKGNTLTSYGLLYFDPTKNGYPTGSMEDMGAMFVPTDKAMNDYLNSDKGRYLKDAYGSWENVPTSLLALFLKNHQKKSFMTALPHMWSTMTDESSSPMNVLPSDITNTYVGTNGAVFVSNAVYPPIDYQCVYASTLVSDNTSIMNWGIQDQTMKFYIYLRSMENMYNLIVPIDEAFQNYRDPVAWAKGPLYREIWSFYYVSDRDMVYAEVYAVDDAGNKAGKLRDLTYSNADQAIIKNRIRDIIDMHIVIGEKSGSSMSGYIDDGNTQYARTKSGTTLKIAGSGDNTTMTGGGDIEQNVAPAVITVNSSTGMKSRYDSDNGRTFFVDKILQDPVKSVYTVMGEHSEYAAFFNLLQGDPRVFEYFTSLNDKDIIPIFDLKRMTGSSGMGYVVNSFSNFRYSVFIPTEAALEQAFAEDDKLFTWEEIYNDTEHDSKKEKTLYLLNFLKYHFMDNSVYIDGKAFSGTVYETAARNESGKFRKLTVSGTGVDLEISGEKTSNKAKVIKTAGLYNQMTRDYIVNNADYTKANSIISSSRAVIHLIDKALRFE